VIQPPYKLVDNGLQGIQGQLSSTTLSCKMMMDTSSSTTRDVTHIWKRMMNTSSSKLVDNGEDDDKHISLQLQGRRW